MPKTRTFSSSFWSPFGTPCKTVFIFCFRDVYEYGSGSSPILQSTASTATRKLPPIEEKLLQSWNVSRTSRIVLSGKTIRYGNNRSIEWRSFFSERKMRSKSQVWALARVHSKWAERERKVALIPALKIVHFLRELMYEIQIFYYDFSKYFFDSHAFGFLNERWAQTQANLLNALKLW